MTDPTSRVAMHGHLAKGRYALEEVIGEGGMAMVVRATDTALGVDRAIKIMHQRLTKDSVRHRLVQEARAMAGLDHPHILKVYDIGQQDELDYVVMDLAPGGSVQDLLERSGPLPLGQALRLMIQVLSALACAHSVGIVHRDVKPHNVLLTANGRALLADFGIALLSQDIRSTRTGTAMGSLAYMAPEQRLDASRVGPAADVYAAGASLYAMVTGTNPVDLYLDEPDSERFSEMNLAVVEVIRRACAPRPAERIQSAGELAAELMKLVEELAPEELDAVRRYAAGDFPAPSDHFSSERGPMLPRSFQDTTTPAAAETFEASLTAATMIPAAAEAPEPVERRRPGWALVPALVAALLVPLVIGWAVLGPSRRAAAPPQPPVEIADVLVPGAGPSLEVSPPAPPEPVPEGASDAAPAPAPVVAAPPAPAPAAADHGGSDREDATPAEEAEPKSDAVAVHPSPGPEAGLSGQWTGNIGGRSLTLDLTTVGQVASGRFQVRFFDNLDVSDVEGHWERESRTLVLHDVADEPDSGRYDLVLDDEGTRLEGRFVREAGGVRRLVLRRTP